MRGLSIGLAIVASTCCAGLFAPANASLLVNGGFEGGPPLNFGSYGRGIVPAGWNSTGVVEIPDIISNAYVAANSGAGGGFATYLYAQEGTQFLDMNGASTNGALYQDVSGLTPGASVTLTFWTGRWAQNSTGNLYATLLDPVANALLGGEHVFFDHQPSLSSGIWTQYSVTGTVGASGTVRVLFAGDSPATDRASLALDNVALTGSVPEPASWAMMIGGFGLVGGALRRRGAGRALTA
jgi:hypothetical protein